MQNYPELSLRPGIYSLLRGNAKELLEGLPTVATVHEIVDMLMRQYGTVESSDQLLVSFYRKSQSPWASAEVLVWKKDGSLRFCIDLRKLNARTIWDAYGLPHIDETLDCLKGALLFSSIDLKAGYWQVEMDEDSKALTAFTVGPLGFYECERKPFALTNAPATFQ